jgi:hypothetical protein
MQMGHKALNFEDVREAYQSQLPQRRDDFHDEVRRLKVDCTKKQCVFSKYVYEVANAAKKEMRARYHAAMLCVEALIDDGWLPDERQTIDSVYGAVFQGYRSVDRESFADLTSAVKEGFEDVGRNGPNICGAFEKEIGQVQVSAYAKCVAQLRLRRPKMQAGGSAFSGSVGVVQIGNMNSAAVARDEE